jgi:hypothetical protein
MALITMGGLSKAKFCSSTCSLAIAGQGLHKQQGFSCFGSMGTDVDSILV